MLNSKQEKTLKEILNSCESDFEFGEILKTISVYLMDVGEQMNHDDKLYMNTSREISEIAKKFNR